MNVLITGAGGFIGTALVQWLLSVNTPLGAIAQLVLIDQRLDNVPTDPRVCAIEGDFGDARVLREALQTDVDVIFHLASVPGGLAEREFEIGMRVNLHAMVALLETVRRQGRRPRFVFASTIGVYGVPLPVLLDENTPAGPTMSYGAQKLIGEILVSDYSRRGLIEGISLRLPGIVARPPQPSGLLSAFLSDSIRTLAAGGRFTFPVGADGTSWWMSRRCIVGNLLHAASMEATVLESQRVWLLPVLHASMREIVDALARVHGDHVLQNVRYEPNEKLHAQFASYPPLQCPRALAAGFRNDGTLESLVQRALDS
jgi:nucleoside-diphosphate-sugar epimerase